MKKEQNLTSVKRVEKTTQKDTPNTGGVHLQQEIRREYRNGKCYDRRVFVLRTNRS